MILLIDNYDSFVYNLYQLVGSINEQIKVIRNDEMSVEEIIKLDPKIIIISPGPGKPSDAGIIEDVIRYFYNKKPILGVCLGHQAICEAFESKITYAKELFHGKTSVIKIDNKIELFKGLSSRIEVARYHSLVVDEKTLSADLKVIARSDDEVMAVKHIKYPLYGLQFHPESILTKDGMQIIKNFLEESNND